MINPDDYDVFYFSRSDLSDELKLEIMRAKIEKARANKQKGNSAQEVRERLVKKYSLLMKNVS